MNTATPNLQLCPPLPVVTIVALVNGKRVDLDTMPASLGMVTISTSPLDPAAPIPWDGPWAALPVVRVTARRVHTRHGPIAPIRVDGAERSRAMIPLSEALRYGWRGVIPEGAESPRPVVQELLIVGWDTRPSPPARRPVDRKLSEDGQFMADGMSLLLALSERPGATRDAGLTMLAELARTGRVRPELLAELFPSSGRGLALLFRGASA